MRISRGVALLYCGLSLAFLCLILDGTEDVASGQQTQDQKKDFGKKDFDKKDQFFGGKGGKGPGGETRKLIPMFDKDGDGRLNTAERQAAREFVRKEGGGGKGGFGKGGKGPKGPKGGFGPEMFLANPLLVALDTDKDGKVSKAELLAGLKSFFADCDKDKRGLVTEAQLAEGFSRILPVPPALQLNPPGFPPGGAPGGPMGLGNMIAAGVFTRADANKDGKVSIEELTTAAEALFQQVDKNKQGKLDESELSAGIALLVPPPEFGPGGFGPGMKGPKGFGKGGMEPGKPGPKVSPQDVKSYPNSPLYDTTVLRTFFLEFENTKDWEDELADFYRTDVDVPATVIVDGKKYAEVGVHFHGNTSYFGVPAGLKRSLHLTFDFGDSKQRLYGYKTFNLLNAHEDPTFMHTVLYLNIARNYTAAPKANFVKVVINGESWGIYANQQHFNKEFLQDNFKSPKGARWHIHGNPGGTGAGLDYLGEEIAPYKARYQIKSKDDPKDWKALINLCRVLNKTPTDKLEEALKPILDIEGALGFLAIDIASSNGDGYWTRGSDYNICLDSKGIFHIVPYDVNETFSAGGGKGPKGGPGGKDSKDKDFKGKDFKDKDFKDFKGKDFKGDPGKGGKGGKGGPGGGGSGPDPLSGVDGSAFPLRSKLLKVPSLQKRYLEIVRAIAEDWFDWTKLKPVVEQYRSLIEKEIEIDTRKLSSLAEFKAAVSEPPAQTAGEIGKGFGGGDNLKNFADQRRSFLLNHPAIKQLGPRQGGGSK